MELSSIELKYIVNNLQFLISDNYYISNITNITKDSFIFKFHHSTKNDIFIVIAGSGLWITKKILKTIEESDLLKTLRSNLERSKIVSIEQYQNERIIKLTFKDLFNKTRILICEFFSNGNIILCNDDLEIISILHSIQVRHRTLRPGLKYLPPPSRGLDIFTLNSKKFLTELKNETKSMTIPKWLGRSISLPKKFIEEIVFRTGIDRTRDIKSLSSNDLDLLFKTTIQVREEILSESMHKPIIFLNQDNKAYDISPILLSGLSDNYKHVPTFLEGLDEVLSNLLVDETLRSKSAEYDHQLLLLKHDLDEQEKAKILILEKSQEIRIVANEIMKLGYNENLRLSELVSYLNDKNLIVSSYIEKGKEYLKVHDEKFFFSLNPNLPEFSSRMYNRAKELERGLRSIDEAQNILIKQISEINQRSVKAQKSVMIKNQVSKDWYEKYRWFITSDGLLAIGGRDASSNSVIVRKHLGEHDLIFHAEIHGSPFFILKKNAEMENLERSMYEVGVATVSFSRAWKDGLSSADSYWVHSNQIKKGAPTGQFLPKGSFVIEGKRTYFKGLELKVGIGIVRINDRFTLMAGPEDCVKKRSIVFAILRPGNYGLTEFAKKVKSELFRESQSISIDLCDIIKHISIDDFIRALPIGNSSILSTGKGETPFNLI